MSTSVALPLNLFHVSSFIIYHVSAQYHAMYAMQGMQGVASIPQTAQGYAMSQIMSYPSQIQPSMFYPQHTHKNKKKQKKKKRQKKKKSKKSGLNSRRTNSRRPLSKTRSTDLEHTLETWRSYPESSFESKSSESKSIELSDVGNCKCDKSCDMCKDPRRIKCCETFCKESCSILTGTQDVLFIPYAYPFVVGVQQDYQFNPGLTPDNNIKAPGNENSNANNDIEPKHTRRVAAVPSCDELRNIYENATTTNKPSTNKTTTANTPMTKTTTEEITTRLKVITTTTTEQVTAEETTIKQIYFSVPNKSDNNSSDEKKASDNSPDEIHEVKTKKKAQGRAKHRPLRKKSKKKLEKHESHEKQVSNEIHKNRHADRKKNRHSTSIAESISNEEPVTVSVVELLLNHDKTKKKKKDLDEIIFNDPANNHKKYIVTSLGMLKEDWVPRYGIVPIPDKIAAELINEMRSMKNLKHHNEKQITTSKNMDESTTMTVVKNKKDVDTSTKAGISIPAAGRRSMDTNLNDGINLMSRHLNGSLNNILNLTSQELRGLDTFFNSDNNLTSQEWRSLEVNLKSDNNLTTLAEKLLDMKQGIDTPSTDEAQLDANLKGVNLTSLAQQLLYMGVASDIGLPSERLYPHTNRTEELDLLYDLVKNVYRTET